MEEVKIFLTDFDFENRLSKSSFVEPHYNRTCRAFESLFLWTEEESSCLYSPEGYEESFLNYIKSKRGLVPKISNNKRFTDLWWGKGSHVETWLQEKEINSKETSFRCRQELGIDLSGSSIIMNSDQLCEMPLPFVIKNFFGFAGRGMSFVRNSKELQSLRLKRFPVLCEPLKKRVRDFGVFYSQNSRQVIENLIDSQGQFRGALVKNSIPEEELILEKTLPIFNWYQSNFSVGSLQIDCFQYLEQGELKLNALCEVNHRNTMGRVALKIHKSLGGKSSAFLIVPKNKVLAMNSQEERDKLLSSLNFNLKNGVLTLSPVENDFQTVFLSEDSDRSLQMLIMSWWKKVRISSGEPLPREFIINS